MLHIDFETRGTVELRDVGVDNYSVHPDTDVWCIGVAEGDEEPFVIGYSFQDLRQDEGSFLGYVKNGGLVYAHNAHFELAIWNNILVPRYGWPVLRPEQMRCTMAMAYAMALPGSLEKAAAAVGITQQKDMAGNRLMLQMCRPKGVSPEGEQVWWDEPEKLHALYEYCKQDVRVERELAKRLLALSPSEQALWELDYRINQRGVYLDKPTILAAIPIVESETDRLNKELRQVTGNVVGFNTEVKRLTEWIQSRGVMIDSLAKNEVIEALLDGTIPPSVHDALLIRQEAGKTSTAKLTKMISAMSTDGRVKDTMQFHGAGTGRWAGRRIQPHNLPRPKLSQAEVEAVLDMLPTCSTADAIAQIELLYGQPMTTISDCLRGMICAAPGKELIAGDYANIEGRVVAWLAGEEWKLEAFRQQDKGTGPEIYKLAASKIYHKPASEITKAERQIGKIAELALGYQGGAGAFVTMAKTTGVKVEESEAGIIKDEWRSAHPNIVQFWYDLERAAYDAVFSPGLKTSAGDVVFRVKGSFLFCLLPNGRLLTYPYPKLKPRETPWGEVKEQVHYMAVNGISGKWEETHTYGGKLAENITQAVARDILADAIVRLEAEKFPIVLHVHDEIVVELKEREARVWEGRMFALMSEAPAWAAGLPIKVEGWRGHRYRK